MKQDKLLSAFTNAFAGNTPRKITLQTMIWMQKLGVSLPQNIETTGAEQLAKLLFVLSAPVEDVRKAVANPSTFDSLVESFAEKIELFETESIFKRIQDDIDQVAEAQVTAAEKEEHPNPAARATPQA